MRPGGRSRKRSVEPESVASVMEGLMARIGGDDRAREHRVFAAFDAAVGPVLRRETEPEGLKGATLFVRVRSSAMAHQVALLKGEIIGRLGRELGPGIVDDVRTRVGPLKAEPRSPGR